MDAERFRNRKGFFLLNVQTVSSSDLRVVDIVARWPGSTHDSTIFDNSLLRTRFEAGEFPAAYHLISDSGYACRSYNLTPIAEPVTRAEREYNDSHIRARNPVERQYGMMKRMFPCLQTGLRCNIHTAKYIIVAVAVLFNICLTGGLVDENIQFDGDEEDHQHRT